LKLEETLPGFFWVLAKDHLPKFLEFSEHISVGKSKAEVRQQCSLGAVDAKQEEPVIDTE